jgi:ketosteroid isomerase-like protein
MSIPGQPAADIQALLDKQAIAELVFGYSRAVDRKDFALLRSLYTDDGFDDHGGLYCGSASGYIDWLEQAMSSCEITTHSVHNHLIALLSADRAEGEVYVTAYHRLHNGSGGYNELIEGLRYLDHYQKNNGRWQFARRTLINDWAQVGPAFWDLNDPALKGTPIGRCNADDPSYRLLAQPLFKRR